MNNVANEILAIMIEDPKSRESDAGTGVGCLSFVGEEVNLACVSGSNWGALANL